MDKTLLTIIFASVPSIIVIGFISHIIYLMARYNREISQGIRRSRSFLVDQIIFESGIVMMAAFIGSTSFEMASHIIQNENFFGLISLAIFLAVPTLATIVVTFIITGLTLRYVEVNPTGFTFRNKLGRTRNFSFNDVGGYHFRPFVLGKYGPPPGGHLQFVDTTGRQLFEVQIRSTSRPDQVGQYAMFWTLQGRWPQYGNHMDEQVLASYTSDAMISFFKPYSSYTPSQNPHPI